MNPILLNSIARGLAFHIKCLASEMTLEERIEFFRQITKGYCQNCGIPEKHSKCQCDNDE